MPDLLTHYMASYLVAKALVGPRRALLLAFVGLLPDVDALLLVHRWVTHSIPVALLDSAPLLVLTYTYRRGYFGVVCASCATLHPAHSHGFVDGANASTLTPSAGPSIEHQG